MAEKIKILVVDDEVRFLTTLAQRLSLRDFDVTAVTSGHEAIDRADEQEFDLALVDLKMPGISGEEVLEQLKRQHPFLEVVILTGHGSVDSAVQCTQAGSYRYLQKPCETEQLLEVLKQAFQARVTRLLKHDGEKMKELERIAIGTSPLAILKRLKQLEKK